LRQAHLISLDDAPTGIAPARLRAAPLVECQAVRWSARESAFLTASTKLYLQSHNWGVTKRLTALEDPILQEVRERVDPRGSYVGAGSKIPLRVE
jgi:hypothetical protein